MLTRLAESIKAVNEVPLAELAKQAKVANQILKTANQVFAAGLVEQARARANLNIVAVAEQATRSLGLIKSLWPSINEALKAFMTPGLWHVDVALAMNPKTDEAKRYAAMERIATVLSERWRLYPYKRRKSDLSARQILAKTASEQGVSLKEYKRRVLLRALPHVFAESSQPQRFRLGRTWPKDSEGKVTPIVPNEEDWLTFNSWLLAKAVALVINEERAEASLDINLGDMETSVLTESDYQLSVADLEAQQEAVERLLARLKLSRREGEFLELYIELAPKRRGIITEVSRRMGISPTRGRNLWYRIQQKRKQI